MSNPTAQSHERASAMAAFDDAYQAFLAAFAQAPDDVLPYVPPGDEYALGVLPMHLLDPIHRYLAVLDNMQREGFAALDRSAGPEGTARTEAEARRHAFLVAQRPTGADRAPMLAELAKAHQAVHAKMDALDGATFARQAPVVYAAGSEPYPTSARDIMGWLTDHYREHVDQTGAILAQWRAGDAGA